MTIRIKSKIKLCKLYKTDVWGRLFIRRKISKFSKKWEPRQRTRISLGNFRGDLSKRTKFYRKRRSKYGKRLAVTQKILKFYGPLKERHFLNYLKISRKNKSNIFSVLIEHLESRLDVVLFRSNLVRNIFNSRFNIIHNKIWVNNKVINKPMYKTMPQDIICLSNPKYTRKILKRSRFIWGYCPEHLHINWKTYRINKYAKANLKTLNFPFKIKPRRILEFYRI